MATAAAGLTFSFGGSNLTITNVQVQDTSDVIDASHLGMASNARREYIAGFTDAEVTVDYLSSTQISAGSTGTISITGPFSYSGNGTVTSSSLGGAVGDLIKGSATFKVS